MRETVLIFLILFGCAHAFHLLQPSMGLRRVGMGASSVATSHEVEFGALKISDKLSSRLKSKGIQEPSGIQITSLHPVQAGSSCILHAATGTGKTLCFSLPIMSRLLKTEDNRRPLQALIIVPSKDLCTQVAADFTSLEEPGVKSIVQNLYSNDTTKTHDLSCPVVVGTAYKVLDLLRSLENTERVRQFLCGIDTLVLDEVDRLLPTVGRYATYGDQRKAHEAVNPTRDLVALLNKARASRGPKGRKISPPGPLQVVACSATVGRPLRREMCNIFPTLEGGYASAPTQMDDRFPIFRPPDAPNPVTLATSAAISSTGESASTPKPTRMVGIPPGILHRMLIMDEKRASTSTLAHKLGLLRGLWVSDQQLTTGILFVPKSTDVEMAAAMLKLWGVYCVTEVTRMVEKDFSKRGNILKRPNKVHGQVVSQTEDLSSTTKTSSKAPRRVVLVLPLSSSRGLHIPDVDCVMLSQPPASMDEYLHAAGRTGRLGSARPGQGVVFTVVNEEQLGCMRSWQTPLGIQIDGLRQVNH